MLGKTLTIAYRVAYLISKGVDPEEILVLTLTNRSISEFRTRMHDLVGADICAKLKIHTFHSFCLNLLTLNYEILGLDPNLLVADKWDQTYVAEVSLWQSCHLWITANDDRLCATRWA